MTIDMLAHYLWGIGLVALACITALVAFEKISLRRYNLGFVLILFIIGVTYNQLLFNGFDFIFRNFSSMMLSNQQHYLIDMLSLFVGLVILLYAKQYKLTHIIKSIGFLIAAAILAFHDQGHVGGHNQATWLTIYHQSLAGLLFIVGVAHGILALMQGRYSKVLYSVIAICLCSAGLTLLLYQNPTPPSHSSSCGALGRVIDVTLDENGFSKNELSVNICDILVIQNTGGSMHKVAFGNHSAHGSYGIYKETDLNPNDKTVIILSEVGEFKLHDHFNDSSTMQLEVK